MTKMLDNSAIWKIEALGEVPEGLSSYDFIVAQLLMQRGITTHDEAERFLNPTIENLGNPLDLPDMEKAVERIRAAIKDQENIVVYGDYDVDGVTSATILISALHELKANATVYLPERLKEGYGLNIPAIEKIRELGAQLLITVDNGTVSHEQIKFANSVGLEVIVVDHHEVHDTLPEALAVINAKRKDSKYHFAECCAAGAAYHLVRVLIGDEEAKKYLDLAAIGTIADVVPLISDNRVFAVEGLKLLNKTERIGLKALIDVCGLKDKKMDVYHIGFNLGPRLNAAGRIDHARLAFDLLNAQDEPTAYKLAQQINDLNVRRQDLTGTMLEQALSQDENYKDQHIILLAQEGWSIGVAGIVAGRLVEKYSKPAVVFEIQEDHYKGSARSVDGVHIVELFNEVKEHIEHYGGHAKAAGLSVAKDSFEIFKSKLEEWCLSNVDKGLLCPRVNVAVALEIEHVTTDLLMNVEKFAPFGFGNATPVFALKEVSLGGFEMTGFGNSHLKLQFMNEAGRSVQVVAWDSWEMVFDLVNGKKYDVAFTMSVNEWQGRKSLQMKLTALRESVVREIETPAVM